jgi:hypothetical protein
MQAPQIGSGDGLHEIYKFSEKTFEDYAGQPNENVPKLHIPCSNPDAVRKAFERLIENGELVDVSTHKGRYAVHITQKGLERLKKAKTLDDFSDIAVNKYTNAVLERDAKRESAPPTPPGMGGLGGKR